MRRLILSLLLLLSTLAFAFTLPAGKYAGQWIGTSSDGTIKIALTQSSAKDSWNADVSFTLGDQEVKCKTLSIKVEGEKLDLVYEFNLSGLQAASTVSGKFENGKLEGSYTTKSSDGAAVDQGTFKTTLEK